jgi:hypothetical protein
MTTAPLAARVRGARAICAGSPEGCQTAGKAARERPDDLGIITAAGACCLIAAGCDSRTATSVSPLTASSPPQVSSVAPARTGSDGSKTGMAYPFELFTHCGIEFANFGGRTWQADSPRPEPGLTPDTDGITRYTAENR